MLAVISYMAKIYIVFVFSSMDLAESFLRGKSLGMPVCKWPSATVVSIKPRNTHFTEFYTNNKNHTFYSLPKTIAAVAPLTPPIIQLINISTANMFMLYILVVA